VAQHGHNLHEGFNLSHFENEPILDDDYVQAAQFHNIFRRAGIQGSHPDFLICSCAWIGGEIMETIRVQGLISMAASCSRAGDQP
jgi:hypothetical protein